MHMLLAFYHTYIQKIMLYCKNLEQNQRIYKMFIRTYYCIDTVRQFIDCNSKYICHYAYIEHDQETEVHIHLLVTFKQPISPLNVYNKLTIISDNELEQNTEIEIPNDITACYEYLIHKNHKDKYQYDKSKIITDNAMHFEKSIDNQYQSNIEFLNDLLNLDSYSMAVKYGRDYIRNYNSYNSFRQMILVQDKYEP